MISASADYKEALTEILELCTRYAPALDKGQEIITLYSRQIAEDTTEWLSAGRRNGKSVMVMRRDLCGAEEGTLDEAVKMLEGYQFPHVDAFRLKSRFLKGLESPLGKYLAHKELYGLEKELTH